MSDAPTHLQLRTDVLVLPTVRSNLDNDIHLHREAVRFGVRGAGKGSET